MHFLKSAALVQGQFAEGTAKKPRKNGVRGFRFSPDLNCKLAKVQYETFKLIINGDTGVGKSCLLAKVMDNDFKLWHKVTIGVEFNSFVFAFDSKI